MAEEKGGKFSKKAGKAVEKAIETAEEIVEKAGEKAEIVAEKMAKEAKQAARELEAVAKEIGDKSIKEVKKVAEGAEYDAKKIKEYIEKESKVIKNRVNAKPLPKAPSGAPNLVSYSDFEKLNLRVATIVKVENVEGADKLYKLKIELGSSVRTIVAGIKQNYTPDELIGKQIIVITNLEPRKMRGIESQGMLLAASNASHDKIVFISPEKPIDDGSKIS
jgi:methionine--tRNA ligase beta chain